MKKYILTALAVFFVCTLAACGAAPGGTAAQSSVPAQKGPVVNTAETIEQALAEEFAAELAAVPQLTADGQVDLSGYSDDELYAMLENGISPNEEAGIDLYAFVSEEELAEAAYAEAELEWKEPEILPFAEGPVPDDGFVFEELTPEMQAALAEMEADGYEMDPEELEELAKAREELQGQMDEVMQQLQDLGIDLSKYGLQGLVP